MKNEKEIKEFANDVVNFALTIMPKEELKMRKMLLKKMNEVVNAYAFGMMPIGWKLMITQYANFENETFEDIRQDMFIYHGSMHELFCAVREHEDVKMWNEFRNYVLNKAQDDFSYALEDQEEYLKMIDVELKKLK